MSLKHRIKQQFVDLKAEGQRIDSYSDRIMQLEMGDPNSPEVRSHKVSKEAFCIRSIQLVERICGEDAPHSIRLRELDSTRRN
jgi:hypothetical protein